MNRIVRRAELADAAVIAELIRLAFSTQSRPTNPPPRALHETAATIAAHLDRAGGAVVESGAGMVGAVLWTGSSLTGCRSPASPRGSS